MARNGRDRGRQYDFSRRENRLRLYCRKIDLAGPDGKRLQALGMIEGTEISVLNNKNEGTVIIKMRSTRLALGKGISSHIEIRGKDHD